MKTDIYSFLDSNGVGYKKYEHKAVFTAEEADSIKINIDGVHTKNLFLKSRATSQYYLYIIESHKRADLKHIAELVGEQKLSFGSPEELKDILDITPGSVSVLCLVNDKNKEVKVLVDSEVWNSELVNAHPNTNTATITFSKKDFKKILKLTGHEVTIVDTLDNV